MVTGSLPHLSYQVVRRTGPTTRHTQHLWQALRMPAVICYPVCLVRLCKVCGHFLPQPRAFSMPGFAQSPVLERKTDSEGLTTCTFRVLARTLWGVRCVLQNLSGG